MPDQPIPQPTVKNIAGNPLANYFRQPKIFIKLPSQGQFYTNDSLDQSQTGEYPVYAMTAKDELIFKTPDALLSGQATVEIIKSCVPAIKNPWNMPTIDVDAVLVAIRIATYGDLMDVSASCPNCSTENDYQFNLIGYLEKLNSFSFDSMLHIDPLTIHIRPYTYQEATKTAIKTLEQQKIFNIVNDEEISDEEKLDKFGESFVKLTKLTVDIIAGCVCKIETPEGEVTDSVMITDFINNTSSEIFNKINDHVTKMRNNLEMQDQHVVCQNCEHQYNVNVTMDQANFFAVRS